MALAVMKTAPSGEVDFTFAFEDIVFSIVPSCIVIAIVAASIASSLQRKAPPTSLSRTKVVTFDSVSARQRDEW